MSLSTSLMNDQGKKSGFWSTLPGILSGLAGLVVAITGLITVLNQIGILHVFPPVGGEIQTSNNTKILTQVDAIRLIESWLDAKEETYSPPFDRSIPGQFLTGNRLRRALEAQSNLQAQGNYREYGKPEVIAVADISTISETQASLEVIETEYEALHTGSQTSSSPELTKMSNKTFYLFELVNDTWKISESRHIE